MVAIMPLLMQVRGEIDRTNKQLAGRSSSMTFQKGGVTVSQTISQQRNLHQSPGSLQQMLPNAEAVLPTTRS